MIRTAEWLALACVLVLVGVIIGRWRRGRNLDVALQNPARQAAFVAAAQFRVKPLLVGREGETFRIIEAELIRNWPGLRVFAQPNLGEFLTPGGDDEAARRSINSKRVDMLIVDAAFAPQVAVEYQGDGHYRGSALMRDRVKRTALNSAGVGLVEIPARTSAGEVRRLVRAALAQRSRSE